MARKIVAFLGITAKPTQYQFASEPPLIYPGEVFPEALMAYLDEHHSGFQQALFLVTQDARRKTWPLLAQRNDPRLVPVDIPEGHDDVEMWSWFEALLPYIEEGDSLIFDITHGLRSAPFLVFLFTAYLRQIRQASIERVYYGAYELARGGPVPVIDLSPFVRLLDWLVATAFFQRTGDARLLAEVLRQVAHQRGVGYLKNAADDLEHLSLALMLTRPLQVMELAARWSQTLERIRQDDTPALRPFHELAAQLQQEYVARSLEDPTAHPREALLHEYELIRWYVENNQVLQAATLAVEWLISLAAWLMEGKLVLRLGSRKEWSQALHGVTRYLARRMPEEELTEKAQQLLNAYSEFCQGVAGLWDDLTNLRNDLNHAGMRESASKAAKLAKRMRELMPGLEALGQYLREG